MKIFYLLFLSLIACQSHKSIEGSYYTDNGGSCLSIQQDKFNYTDYYLGNNSGRVLKVGNRYFLVSDSSYSQERIEIKKSKDTIIVTAIVNTDNENDFFSIVNLKGETLTRIDSSFALQISRYNRLSLVNFGSETVFLNADSLIISYNNIVTRSNDFIAKAYLVLKSEEVNKSYFILFEQQYTPFVFSKSKMRGNKNKVTIMFYDDYSHVLKKRK